MRRAGSDPAALNHPPEYKDPWLGKSYFTHLRIDPLARESGASLLRGLLGGGEELEALRAMILRQTEGNPLFMEECVRALAEGGTLAGEPGRYRLVVPVRAVSVPATVQTVLAARIDHLEPAVKRLFQTAAVIGKDFSLPLLRRVVDAPEDQVPRAPRPAAGGRARVRNPAVPEPEYTFKHALTQQVAYEGQLHDRRRELHASILLALEATAGQATPQRSERLAHHAVRGEEWEKAYRHAMDAGLRAAALNPIAVPSMRSRRPPTHWRGCRSSEQRLGQAIDIRFHMHGALMVLGEGARVRALVDAVEKFSAKLQDQRRLVEALVHKSGYHWSQGQHREHSLPIARRAYALASDARHPEGIGLSCYRLASAHALLGEYREATRWAEEGLDALEPQAGTLFRFGGLVYTFLAAFDAMAKAELGDFAGADRVGAAATSWHVAADHAYSETVSAFGLTHSLLLQDRVGEALPILERGLDKIAVHGVQATAAWVAGRAAYAFASVGREADSSRAVEIVQSGTELSPSMRHGFAFTWAARGCLVLGRFDRAVELGSYALRNPTPDPERGVHAWAHWVLGEATRNARATDLDASGRAYDAALDLAGELGMRPLQALCRFGKARIAAERGDGEMADADARTRARDRRKHRAGAARRGFVTVTPPPLVAFAQTGRSIPDA